jgi:DNA-binding transcriptional ArsR family regulator
MIDETYMGFFKTLCNETRLGIVLCLREEPKSVSQLIKELNMEQSRVSHNLQCLTRNGFLTVKQEGKQRIYSLNKDTMVPILRDVNKHVKKYKLCSC